MKTQHKTKQRTQIKHTPTKHKKHKTKNKSQETQHNKIK